MARVGDQERERAARQLRGHYLRGRLSEDELDDRLAVALTARSHRDARRALDDLPAGWRDGELADSTGLPKSTTSRLLGALERQGLLQRVDGRGRLRPGPVLLRFAQRDVPETNLVDLSTPALRRLAEASGETINLGVATALGVDHLAQRDSRHFVGATNWVGRRVPHDVSANGKVFLAYGVIPPPPGFDESQLAPIRERGYAVAVDELERGLS